jgi:hypothetical protein
MTGFLWRGQLLEGLITNLCGQAAQGPNAKKRSGRRGIVPDIQNADYGQCPGTR